MNSLFRKISFILFVGIFVFLSFDFAHAAFNPEINYQGKLTDNSDNPVSGNYNLEFRLCADSGCSTVLWTEIRTSTNKVAVTNGLFSVLLGEVTSLATVNFNQPVYLEVSVGGTGTPSFETLSPAKLLGAVPAAMEANKLNGLTSSAYAKLATDEVVTGIWNFNNLLSVTANSSAPALSISQIGSGAGIAVGNGFVTTSISATSTSVFNYGASFASTGGAVTIGPTIGYSGSPMLGVHGNVSVVGNIDIVGAITNNGISVVLPSAGTGQTLYYGDAGWAATSALYIGSNGSVGIGTTSASSHGALLEVNGPALFDASSTFIGTTTFVGATNFSSAMNFSGSNTFDGQMIVNNSATFASTSTFNNILVATGKIMNPVQVGEILNGDEGGLVELKQANSMYISGGFAYVAATASSTLEIINISDPAHPTHASKMISAKAPEAVVVAGNYAYLVSGGFYGGLEVVDISDSYNPVHVGFVQVQFAPGPLFISGNYAYIASYVNNNGINGLEVVDISNPKNPILVGEYAASFVSNVFVSGKYAYLISQAPSNTLEIVDISNPKHPVHAGAIADGDEGGLVNLEDPVDIFVSGNYAYVTASNTLEIVDISNPTNPTHVGKLVDPGNNTILGLAQSVFVSGKYAYVGAYGSNGQVIAIVDISDPTEPVWKSDIPNGDSGLYMTSDIIVKGNYLYGLGQTMNSDDNGSIRGLVIEDISGAQISNAEIGSAKISNLSILNAAEFGGDINIKGGLKIGSGGLMLNADFGMFSNTTNTLSFSTTTIFQTSVTDTASNSFIFDSKNFSDSSAGYLLSVRANGQDKFRVNASGTVEAMNANIYGNGAFSGTVSTTDLIVNGVSASQYFIDSAGTNGYVWQSDGSGQGHWADPSGFGGGGGSVDQMKVSNPTLTGSLSNSGDVALAYPDAVVVAGKYAYVASAGSSALEVVDVSNPANPVHVAKLLDTVDGAALNNPVSIFVSGKYAYLASFGSSALEVVDISNPAHPRHAGKISDGNQDTGDGGAALNNPTSVYVSGKYAYVTAWSSNSLEVVDISNPTQPRHIGRITNGDAALLNPNSVFVSGNFAYVASNGSDALEIINISDPAHPTHATSTSHASPPFLDGPRSVYVSGKYVYIVSAQSSALEIMDISDPYNPTHVGAIGDGGGPVLHNANSVFVSGKYAYVAAAGESGTGSLEIIDISDPAYPTHVGDITNTGAPLSGAYGVYVAGNYAYVAANGSSALTIIDVTGASISNVELGTARVNSLSIVDAADFNGNVHIRGSLNVSGGLLVNNPFAVNVSSTNGTIFSIGTNSTSSILAVDANGDLIVNGSSVGQYLIDSSGVSGYLWQSTGNGRGHWVDPSGLGGGGGSLPSADAGDILVSLGGGNWGATNTLFVSSSGEIYISGVLNSTVVDSGAGSNLLSNPGFEDSLSTTSPWSSFVAGDADYEVTSTYHHDGSNGLFVESHSGLAAFIQNFTNPGSADMAISFYGAAGGDNFIARVNMQGDNCGVGNSRWNYNFNAQTWDCVDFNGSAHSDYTDDFTLPNSSFAQESVSFTSLPSASSTGGISLIILAGSSDSNADYINQTIIFDDVSVAVSAGSPAFVLNAPGFSPSSANSTLLSIRANGTERIKVSATGAFTTAVGVYNSNVVAASGASESNNLVVNPSFEASPPTSSWDFMAINGSGDPVDPSLAFADVSSSFPNIGANSVLLYNSETYAAIAKQEVLSVPYQVTTTLTFHGAALIDGSVLRYGLQSGSCDGGDKYVYNFSNSQWECHNLFNSLPSLSDPYLNETTVNSSGFSTTSFSFLSPPSASSTGSVDVLFIFGDFAEDSGTIGLAAIDDVSLTYSQSNTLSSAFTFDAKNFAGSSGEGYLLSLRASGTEKFRITADGNIETGGGANISGTSTFGGSVLINTTTNSNNGGSYKLLVDSGADDGLGIGVRGYIKSTQLVTGMDSLDLAETYPINENCALDNSCPEVGDVVCTDKGDKLAIKKCAIQDQDKILGVVSGKPGMILGGSDLGINSIFSTSTRPIALAGRVPVKIILASGTIEVGDELTISSSSSGVAEKSIEPGRIVGVALQKFGSSTSTYPQVGTVLMYVNPHFSVGNVQATDISDEFPDFSQTILDKFTLSVKNSLRKLGIIIKEGVLKVKEVFTDRLNTNTLCVGNTCINESQLQDLLNKNSLSAATVTMPVSPTNHNLDTSVSTTQDNNTISSSSTDNTIGVGGDQTVVNVESSQSSNGDVNTVISEQETVSSPSIIPAPPPPISEPAIVLPSDTQSSQPETAI